VRKRRFGGAAKYSQCGGKKRYREWRQASVVAKIRMREGADELRIYECNLCGGGFHLTKQKIKGDKSFD
jgi:hypothetical protein